MEIIHIVLGKANPNRMNGVNKVVYQLASHQVASGRNVSVWGISKNLEENYGKRNFKTKIFKAKRNPFRLDKKLKSTILSKKGKAIFHLHGGWIPTFASISKFLKKKNIPYVLTAHGAYNSVARKRSKWIKKIYFQLFEKSLLEHSQKIHAIGESEVLGLQEIYPNTKSFLLPYGFITSSDAALAFNTKEQTGFTIGFVGRLDIHTKGLDLLLEAFKKFQEIEKNSQLWIVGDSTQRPVLEKMIAEHNIQNITLWGSKYGEEKDTLISKMDVFVHPSRNEGLPTAVLEAAYLGTPSVVSKATNVGTYINQYEAGLMIENENIEELTDSFFVLHQLWKRQKLDSLGKNAQKMVSEAFHWGNLVPKFDELYKSHPMTPSTKEKGIKI